jgi:hypothetical protein
MPVTDGAGGYVDLKPAKDTVQFRVNEALKGQTVTWEFELVHDARESYGGVIRLIPKSLKPQSDAEDKTQDTIKSKEKAIPFLNALLVKVPRGQAGGSDFKAGDRVKLEGAIGDASGNKGINALLSPSGPVAVYHLDAAPHTVFWVGLTKATITGPNRRTVPRRKPAADVVKVAKALIRASYFQYDEETLKEIYASEVQLLPGNRLFQYGLEVPRAAAKLGVVIDREKMLPAVATQAGRDPVPRQFVEQFVNKFRIEQLEVAEGEFVTEPNQPSESHDGKLRFSIRKGDVLLKVSVPGAFRFVQLRKTDGKWEVVAEY